MKKISFDMLRIIIFLLFFCILSSQVTHAASPYVLPYPSTMPGGISYKLHLIWEKIMQYWYFGDFGQFDYNVKQSDKYLVEAKTLFEYQQYLLGYSALQKSNEYFIKTLPDLQNAHMHGKDIAQNRQLLKDAATKHIEVLKTMENETPDSFYWSPEKSPASELQLHQLINTSLQITSRYE